MVNQFIHQNQHFNSNIYIINFRKRKPMHQAEESSFKIQQFEEEISSELLNVRKRNNKSQQKSETCGKWEKQEHYKYLSFINFLIQRGFLKRNSKISKMFKLMASFIKSRNSIQCRSHHQKMEEKFGTFKNIIKKSISSSQSIDFFNLYTEKLPQLESFIADFNRAFQKQQIRLVGKRKVKASSENQQKNKKNTQDDVVQDHLALLGDTPQNLQSPQPSHPLEWIQIFFIPEQSFIMPYYQNYYGI